MLVIISGTHHCVLFVSFTRDCMVKLAPEFVADQPAIQEMLETLHNTGNSYLVFVKNLFQTEINYNTSCG